MSKLAFDLSLVLPAYNEEENIEPVTIAADVAMSNLLDRHEIIIVDDGSRDGTAAAIRRLEATCPRVRSVAHAENRGYGEALRSGFAVASMPYVAFTDSDGQFDPADLGLLLPLLAENDFAIGYRRRRLDPLPRLLYSRAYGLIVWGVFGLKLRDLNCALKVMDREKLMALPLSSTHYFINVEMLVRARERGYRIAQAGVRHLPRAAGQSKVRLGDVARALREIGRLRARIARERRRR